MKVEVAVLGSPSLIGLMVSAQHLNKKQQQNNNNTENLESHVTRAQFIGSDGIGGASGQDGVGLG